MWPFSKKKTLEEKVGDLIRTEAPDFSRLFNNIANLSEAEVIYKNLSATLHPDRFVGFDDEMRIKAESLFKELQGAKTDIDHLHQLKEKADILLKKN